jgi:hypothetical protein
MSSPLRLVAGLAAAATVAFAAGAPSAHALPRQNVCGPGWYASYSNDVSTAGYFGDQVNYYWNLMDVVQPADVDYVYAQLTSAIGNRDYYQNRANQLLRSCG